MAIIWVIQGYDQVWCFWEDKASTETCTTPVPKPQLTNSQLHSLVPQQVAKEHYAQLGVSNFMQFSILLALTLCIQRQSDYRHTIIQLISAKIKLSLLGRRLPNNYSECEKNERSRVRGNKRIETGPKMETSSPFQILHWGSSTETCFGPMIHKAAINTYYLIRQVAYFIQVSKTQVKLKYWIAHLEISKNWTT